MSPGPQRLHVDWTRCDGHGLCATLMPDDIALDLGFSDLDVDALASLTAAEIERDGGNGGQEIRNWIAALATVPGWKGETLAYEPVPEWITGCATVWMHR
jgi:hypothetical protein